MALDTKARAKFVMALVGYCTAQHLDGIDFDWEFPDNAAEEDAYSALLTDTKHAFAPHGWLVTIAMGPWQHLPAAAYRVVDRVHLMAYDHEGQHSTLTGAVEDVHKMLDKGVAREKLCLGVPFYGRQINGTRQDFTYAEIVQKYHPAPSVNEVDGIYFNGADTMQQKTRYAVANHLGGVMIWELGQDTADGTSLLQAIHTALTPP
jgi:GH18 family chitinase